MFSHILIPTDGSALATLAVDKGIEFARDANAGVTVITVMEPFHIVTADPDQIRGTRAEYEKFARMEGARALTDAELKAKQLGVTCRSVQVESEEPFQAIIDAGEKNSCDLIMMASHGRRGIGALLLGSVTLKVLTHSKIPVLVYR
ncbi:universal stress protein [Phyllobacterium ifriqiyense]|uniref:universal stress protein n=1 Tax=Phyllobacterium ifriqiyense TaxID=314238 RepID=UPI003394AF8F